MSIPYIGIELYNLNIFTASNVSEKLVRKEYCVVTCKKRKGKLRGCMALSVYNCCKKNKDQSWSPIMRHRVVCEAQMGQKIIPLCWCQ